MAEGEKGRLQAGATRRQYLLAAINSATAVPLSRALVAMALSPNAVSGLSLLVSLVGIAAVAFGDPATIVAGALLVHVGLVLDHSDGQVARLGGKGSTWGMYLDMVIDRIVETGLVVASVAAALRQPGVPGPLPPAWEPMGPVLAAATAVACLGAMLTWRFLNAYNDVLYLRIHLLATGRAPSAPAPVPVRGRLPVFNRDWVFLLWTLGTVAGQHQGVLAGLLALHALVCAAKVRAFARHHLDPEARAAAVLAPDYH